MRRPIDRSVQVTGDRATHAAYGVGPATDYALPAGASWKAPLAGTAYPYYSDTGGYSVRLNVPGAAIYFQHGTASGRASGWVGEGGNVGVVGNSGSMWDGYHLHDYVILDDGTRLSFEEWLALKGFKPAALWSIADPTVTSAAGGGGVPIPPEKKEDDDMDYTYVWRETGPGKKPQWALLGVQFPDGAIVTQDIKVANGFAPIARNSAKITDERWQSTLDVAKVASDNWKAITAAGAAGGGDGAPFDPSGIIAAIAKMSADLGAAIAALPAEIDAYSDGRKS